MRKVNKKFLCIFLFFFSFLAFGSKRADRAFEIVENGTAKEIRKAILRDNSFIKYKRGGKQNILMAALESDRENSVIKCLLRAGISPTEKDKNGKTALMYAVENESDIEVIKNVLKCNAFFKFQRKKRILQKDKNGKSALDYAKKNSMQSEIESIFSKYVPVQLLENETEVEAETESEIPAENNAQSAAESETETSLENNAEAENEIEAADNVRNVGKTEIPQESLPQSVLQEIPAAQAVSIVSSAVASGEVAVEVSSIAEKGKSDGPDNEQENILPDEHIPLEELLDSNTKILKKENTADQNGNALISLDKMVAPEIPAESIYLYDYAENASSDNAIPDELLKYSEFTFIENANEKDSKGRTKLMTAAKNGDIKKIRNLLFSGADVNARDNEGWTALMYAVRFQKNADATEVLLKNGASPLIKNNYHINSMMLAAAYSENPKVIEAVIRAYPASSEELRSAFSYGIRNSNSASNLRPFLEKNLQLNVPFNGKTYLMYACEFNKNTDIIALLLDFGAEKNTKEQASGKTAFDYAKENRGLKRDSIYWMLSKN